MNRQLHILTFIFASFLLFSCSSEDQTAAKTALAEATPAETAPAPKSSLLADLPFNDDPNSNTFQTLDGRGFDIELFVGKKVFVNFWATWCAPCIREIPSINRAAKSLEDENYLFLFVLSLIHI